MNEKPYWKDRLYARYISDGQARVETEEVERLFQSRAAYIQQVIRKFIPVDRGIKLLDLGCGHGAFLYFLERAGYPNIVGIDISSEQVDLAHRLGLPHVAQGDIYEYLLGLDGDSIDVILLLDVIEHYSRPQLFELLDEVYRVLRAGGKCIVHVPNGEGLFGLRTLFSDLTHELAFTVRSLQQLFFAVGFGHIACYEDRPIVHNLASGVRRTVWDVGTIPARLLRVAETGERQAILSSNMTAVAIK